MGVGNNRALYLAAALGLSFPTSSKAETGSHRRPKGSGGGSSYHHLYMKVPEQQRDKARLFAYALPKPLAPHPSNKKSPNTKSARAFTHTTKNISRSELLVQARSDTP